MSILLLLFPLFMMAEGYRSYCQVIYNSVSQSAIVIVNDSYIQLKDAKGQPRKFATFISVLNYLSKKGWHLEPVGYTQKQNEHEALMSRENTTDEEIKQLLR